MREIGEHGLGGVDRDGEADARILIGVRQDHGVNADDFAARVEQRSAGVSGIDGRISLDGVFNRRTVAAADGANRTDNPLGHGAAEAEWVADCIHLFADGELARVCKHQPAADRGRQF